MARSQNGKRQRASDLPQDSRPAKKSKSTDEHNFSPAFWDDLSKVWLTPRALRELDRRNNTRPSPEFAAPEVPPTDLTRFARRGGPDLCHLRGCPEPKSVTHEMSSGRPSNSSQSRPIQSTTAKSVSKARRSSAYDADFEQHLINNNIYHAGYAYSEDRGTQKPSNLDQVRQDLVAARASPSLTRLSESTFWDFQQSNETTSEGSVIRNVIPMIAGNSGIPNEGNLPFTNLTSLTNDDTVKAVPDYFDGAQASDIHRQVRRNLSTSIIPTKHATVPVVPNFFLEVKSQTGNAAVVRRQACHDGAYGARAMHALQNYGQTEPVYDGNAYTYSSTYFDGLLRLYAHHVTAPATPRRRPKYHMTKLRVFEMTDSREAFVKGATAFRNARDLARQGRNNLIRAANARASEEELAAAKEGLHATTEMPYQEDSTDESALSSPRYIPEIQHEESSPDELALSSPHHLCQDPSQASMAPDINDPSMSLARSFTSSLSSSQPERQRSSRPSVQSITHPRIEEVVTQGSRE
ncbi:hypothetical protein EDB81DRAFT_635061 [Dactylonectria macrodidyma]|uniref:DUF7924 domain-containing protein n=1 Tax=Dactylonectria macrodidyma TaxID=307937 RepID=A0A9P9FS63_9HYPO|nr:hypothetical protein EDB81DRAFT_635061 [Dactylonectria macrodidyma]